MTLLRGEGLVADAVQPLPWAARVSGMPYLPGGGRNQVSTLRVVLEGIDDSGGDLSAGVDLGDGATRTVGSLTKSPTSVDLVTTADQGRECR